MYAVWTCSAHHSCGRASAHAASSPSACRGRLSAGGAAGGGDGAADNSTGGAVALCCCRSCALAATVGVDASSRSSSRGVPRRRTENTVPRKVKKIPVITSFQQLVLDSSSSSFSLSSSSVELISLTARRELRLGGRPASSSLATLPYCFARLERFGRFGSVDGVTVLVRRAPAMEEAAAWRRGAAVRRAPAACTLPV